jgi:hypothetical protein
MKVKRYLLCFIAHMIFQVRVPLGAGLPEGTLISTPQGLCSVEALSAGSTVVGYYADDCSHPDVIIDVLSCYVANQIMIITTNQGIIRASPEHVFYEITKEGPVAIKDLRIDDMLLTKKLEPCQVEKIETLNEKMMCYTLALKDCCYFFSTELELLTYDAKVASPLAIDVDNFVKLERESFA